MSRGIPGFPTHDRLDFARSIFGSNPFSDLAMTNWIGVAIWILLGGVIGLSMKLFVRLEEETSGHGILLAILGALAAVIGGMLGVGIFQFYEPTALSLGGMAGAVFLAALFSFLYRWGVKGMV